MKGLVYVAAGAPDSGQSFADWWKDNTPAPSPAEIKPYGEGYVALTLEAVRKHFVQDIPSDEADIVYATQGPLAVKCFGERSQRQHGAHDQTGPSSQREIRPFLPMSSAMPQAEWVPRLSCWRVRMCRRFLNRCRCGIHRKGGASL